MSEGRVIEIFTGPEERGPVLSRSSVTAVAGAGLEGDRYFQGDVPLEERDPTLEITLITIEGIRAAAEASGIDITPADTRRNLITEGIELTSLLGTKFWVGEVQIEGLQDNPPCAYLQRMVGKKLLKPLMGRGGIRGRIVTGGTIKPGDPIVPA
ncbi:MAG: MOSC domain-containing protein [Actinomycetota bacterium]